MVYTDTINGKKDNISKRRATSVAIPNFDPEELKVVSTLVFFDTTQYLLLSVSWENCKSACLSQNNRVRFLRS